MSSNKVSSQQIHKLSEQIGSLAIQAMLYEVACFPSPGLVSPVSAGAHKDMNFFTFIDSTCVLIKYFVAFVQEGLEGSSEEQIFKNIRAIGVRAEKEMFEKTKGVNTHKGMLFLMGICCAAVGKAIHDQRRFEDIPVIIRKMTEGLVDKELTTLKKKENLSHGEKLYLKYKLHGVRGEVEKGIPTVFEYSLELFRDSTELSINDRLVHTLIGIMQRCEDSNIVHRHSLRTLKEVQAKAMEIMTHGGMKSQKGSELLQALNEEFIERNISPGGSADLLAITVFIALVHNEFFRDRAYTLQLDLTPRLLNIPS